MWARVAGRRSRGARWTAGGTGPNSAATAETGLRALVAEDGTLGGPVAKKPDRGQRRADWPTMSGPNPAIASSSRRSSQIVCRHCWAARVEIANRLGLIDPIKWAFIWVIDRAI